MQSTLSSYSQQSLQYRYWQAPRWQNPRFASAVTEPIKLAPGGYFAPEVQFDRQFERVLGGVADYWIARMNKTGKRKPVIVAMDDSPLSKRYLPHVINYLVNRKLDVYTYYHEPWKELPMPLGQVAYFTRHFDRYNEPSKSVAGAIMLTAGSRPWRIGGMRFINSKGSLFDANELASVEHYIATPRQEALNIPKMPVMGQRIDFDFMKGHYRENLQRLIDFQQIKSADLFTVYDARQGACKDEFRTIATQIIERWHHINDHFDTLGRKNTFNNSPNFDSSSLRRLSKECRYYGNTRNVNLANNGDGSGCRLLDEKGRLISYKDMLALCLYHLVENKSQRGVLVKTHEQSGLPEQLAASYGIPVIDTPSGFHHIARESQKLTEPLLIAADGQGGFILPYHIPVKDGLLMNFLMMELRAVTGKPFEKLLSELRERLSHVYTHTQLQLKTPLAAHILHCFRNMALRHFHLGPFRLDRVKTQQRYHWVKHRYGLSNDIKLYFEDGSSLVVRQQRENPEKVDFFVSVALRKGLFDRALSKKRQEKLAQLTNSLQRHLEIRFSIPRERFSTIA